MVKALRKIPPVASSEPFDSSVLGSIEHQAEKLGYLIATVDNAFQQRAKDAKHVTLVEHSKIGIEMMDAYLKGELTIDQYAEGAAQLLADTTRRNDETNANLSNAINQLNKAVQDSVEQGKLRFFLEGIQENP